ncbi:MAG: glycosyltransferase family protein [Calditrichaceae bacterium]
MAKIVYGVAGEGSGHSSRAREIGSYLVSKGHQVKMVSYDRGYRNLSDTFDVFETEGLHISSADNKVSVVKTFVDNFSRAHKGTQRFRELKKTLFKDFVPDCVITDFEPMTAYLANHYDIPLITIDNQHRIRYLHHHLPKSMKADYLVTENIIRAIVPRPDISLVTTFYDGKVKNDRTFLFPPILRDQLTSQKSSNEGHIMVYLTSGFESFVTYLAKFKRERFLRNLGSCKAVMATAGFTLITESLYLRKPYLAMPMKGQFEQELNGYMLEKLSYGLNARRTSSKTIAEFLYHIPDFEKQLQMYRVEDNTAITNKLDVLLSDGCRLAREFHEKRQKKSK